MAIYYVNRTCKQTIRREWDEVVFVETETEGEAREKVESNPGTLEWKEEVGMNSIEYETLGPVEVLDDVFVTEVDEPWEVGWEVGDKVDGAIIVKVADKTPRSRIEKAMQTFKNLRQGLEQ